MNFISNHFSDFLATYDAEKLGFIVSQSNVETYMRTEFAWYLEERLNKDRTYQIFIELGRIDLQVTDLSNNLVYIVEFGHHVNLHKLDIVESFNRKYISDKDKLNVKNRFDDKKVEFVHINMLTHFDAKEDSIVHIEEVAATFRKYGNKNKSYNYGEDDSVLKFDFAWKNSKGYLLVSVKNELV
jgi:hypothetical protein